MGVTGKKTVEIEIKSNGDAFHKLFRHKPHHVSNLSPNIVKGCNLHEGEFGNHGSIVIWNYILDGKHQIAKDIVHINEENKSIRFELIEGDLKELYKSITFTVHVNEKEGGGSLVTWIIEYEKLNEGIPDPDNLHEFFTSMAKDIEAGHLLE